MTWQVSAKEVLQFQGDGQRFAELIDALVWAEAFVLQIPAADVSTNGPRSMTGKQGLRRSPSIGH